MANREALRDLQARLASRLQAARADGTSVSWLAVRAGGALWLLPLGQSGEIVPLSTTQPVPYTKPWFRGVVNIRGGLQGVVDLAAFLESNAGRARSEPEVQSPSVVTLNAALELNCALQVDSLQGLRGPGDFTASSPAEAGSPPYFGSQFTDNAGLVWQEINLRELAQSPPFLSISA
jgi:twitching motility protein PilI